MRVFIASLVLAALLSSAAAAGTFHHNDEVNTSVQEVFYDDNIDLKTDAIMVYGDGGCENRMAPWKEHGYTVHSMLGISWGTFDDFFNGKYDGIKRPDIQQKRADGRVDTHIVPVDGFSEYFFHKVQRVINAGARAVVFEEPEFWSFNGYSQGFKDEWKKYYGTKWIPQTDSEEALWKASRLKYYLFYRTIKEVSGMVKDYSKEINRDIKVYIATHSLVNYGWWGLVSPESSLIEIDSVDGIFGQVWTGTSREAGFYNNIKKQRTFEVALCEYGILNNLARAGKDMFYLADPVEDRGQYSWPEYKNYYEATLTASLLFPNVYKYQLMPWPSRVFNSWRTERPAGELKEGEEPKMVHSPGWYTSELMAVGMELRNMKQSSIRWERGTEGIGVLMSDSIMFQRAEPYFSDKSFGFIMGQTYPLIKHGIMPGPVQLEYVNTPGFLKNYKVLFLTYEGQKPLKPEYHTALAEWVKTGGTLVFLDDDSDNFNSVSEWWNTGGMHCSCPREHLFDVLGASSEEKLQKIGKGNLIYRKLKPSELVYREDGGEVFITVVQEACAAAGIEYKETNYLLLRRGPYVIGAGMNETDVQGTKTIKGMYIDLYDDKLSIVKEISLTPDKRIFLKDLKSFDKNKPAVCASSSRILKEKAGIGYISFTSEGPKGTPCSTRILLPKKPFNVVCSDRELNIKRTWDSDSSTLLLEYPNRNEPYFIKVEY